MAEELSEYITDRRCIKGFLIAKRIRQNGEPLELTVRCVGNYPDVIATIKVLCSPDAVEPGDFILWGRKDASVIRRGYIITPDGRKLCKAYSIGLYRDLRGRRGAQR